MSLVGSFVVPTDLPPGASWALIAHSAINHSSDYGTGGGGIMAASPDIGNTILSGAIDQVFVFPGEDSPAGLYVWFGTVTEGDTYDGKIERLHPNAMQLWIDFNMLHP